MKSEIDWLKNFKANLKAMLVRENLIERERIIIWEIDWIVARLDEISQLE